MIGGFLGFLFVILVLQAVNHDSLTAAESHTSEVRAGKAFSLLSDCQRCMNRKDQSNISSSKHPDKDVEIMLTYSDLSGAIQVRSVRSVDLSASWVWRSPDDVNRDKIPSSMVTLPEPYCHYGLSLLIIIDLICSQLWYPDHFQHFFMIVQVPLQPKTETASAGGNSFNDHQFSDDVPPSLASPVHPVKIKRQMLRRERRERRTADLINQDKEMENQAQDLAIERARELDTTIKGKYSIWRKEYENPNSDSTVKLMRDQIIMAKVYAMISKAKNETALYDSLLKHSRESQHSIGEANTDAELHSSVLDQAKAMGRILALAKDKLYDCVTIARKLRVMLQSSETNVNALKKRSSFLIQLAAKTLPRPLHCFPLVLTEDYHLRNYADKYFPNREKLEDPSLYHYAIFSDNVLAASVVVKSTVLHAKDPERHVFHVVTDKLNFAAMRMWFLTNPPVGATIQVQNVDEFTWLNSSYCPVLRQLESARMIEYYFKAHQSSVVASGSDNLKYRNPKYLSMLNHLRFYLPEVYPKLDKILFLDDDVVVQKDLTPLWSVNLHGMVNGAVETCKESFHRFDKYLNFSNPKISENFDPNACGWAFGMNMFDLMEWRKRNITGIYHRWQEMNVERTLWKLGTLPPGLITFYNLTYPLDRSWHVLGLGYDPALNQTEMENAAVVHYNGNYKPWLDLAITKYKSYWSRYVDFDHFYLKLCGVTESYFA